MDSIGTHTNGTGPSGSRSPQPDTVDSSFPSSNGPNNSAASTNGTEPQFPSSHAVFQAHNEELINHLYQGFQTGNYSDIGLHVHHTLYRLHSIVLSRSPLFSHLMSTTPYPPDGSPRTLYLNLDDEPDVTREGLAIALGYLYSSVSVNMVQPENARGVLGAACLLGGIEELCQYAYELCRTSIGADNIHDWLQFLERTPPPTENSAPRNVFGPYADSLREDVFECLVVKLPESLGVTKANGEPEGRKALLQIFAHVPFELFKSTIESPAFQIGSDQQRFKFAKEAIEFRKTTVGKGSEENVVLAFGGGTGGAVHITRRVKKRALWKASNQGSA